MNSDNHRFRSHGAFAGSAATATRLILAFAFMLASVAVAQENSEGEPIPVRIGVILPAGEGDTVAAELDAAVRDAARSGLEMARDELGFNASMLGFELSVEVELAEGVDDAAEAARSLVEQEVLALVGGWGDNVASALSEVAEEADVPFLNIGSSALSLRNASCSPLMFHVVPSGGMYLDAIAGWFVSAGFREWYVIEDEGEATAALADRLERTLRERHFGARIAGRSTVGEDQAAIDAALQEGADADVIVLLARGARQLDLLARADALGIETEITAFPWPETQTREYYAAALEAAPNAGAGHRASAWEPTLDAYGARELNARFMDRFEEPMDAPAWAAYQAIKLVFESVSFGGVRDRAGLAEYLASESAVFDIWKGIGVTFRPWNHQLRQTLFLVELRPGAETAWDRALLVGELPEIYMPRTDPVERLDQLGDLEGPSQCSF